MLAVHTQDFYTTFRERGFTLDLEQEKIAERLTKACYDWVEFKKQRRQTWRRLLNKTELPRGLYLWGSVGCGKSFLMDTFYSTVPVLRKTRIHFHAFMRMVRHELDQLKNLSDPLDAVAEKLAKKYRLICFDEFHISDIADAMILYQLLHTLFARGVCFYMTSNYHPDTLYPNGLHRDRLLPAIEMIKTQMDVMQLNAGIDYRQRILKQLEIYHIPANDSAEKALDKAFTQIAECGDEQQKLIIGHRVLSYKRRAGGVIWFNFKTLCTEARSQNDYLEIASDFHTVIVSNIPKMNADMASSARRFTWLIDVLYDHKIKLLLSAEVPIAQLYTEGLFANEFTRTLSRLTEMQSEAYLNSQRVV